MDHTAGLRKIRGAIENLQNGEKRMAEGKFGEAEALYRGALKEAPDDYAGLLMMAKCQLVLKKHDEARRYAELAKAVYPEEPQAHQITGMAALQKRDFDAAYGEFRDYEKLLPGNPNTIFLKGLSLEGMKQVRDAAQEYARYLNHDRESKQAQYAYRRLVEWGYVKPQGR
jgi:tetratricopeptide (TPR) repeat protein